MILLREKSASSGARRNVAIFGLGLIGRSILQSFRRFGGFHEIEMPFRWSNQSVMEKDSSVIEDRISKLFALDDAEGLNSEFAIVWSAGRAGFSASRDDTESELMAFNVVLELARAVSAVSVKSVRHFHFVGSLGGCYEGMRNITHDTIPSPHRAYGRLKLAQEHNLDKLLSNWTKHVYLPASVYGYTGLGCRMGLIPTLIRNGMFNQVSKIVGGLATLRDYVMASDVGMYIGHAVISPIDSPCTSRLFLATGKPSSILEVQHAVEERLRRRVFVSFDDNSHNTNSRDITVSQDALPRDWFPTDLRAGINIVYEIMFQSGEILSPP